MSENNTAKKKMSKKKKILIIVLSVLLALIVLVVAAGLIALNQYCKTADYTVYQTSENVKSCGAQRLQGGCSGKHRSRI